MGLEGKILGGRYEIIEKIGNGGMATVYKAKCLVLKRYVAVKVLREEFTTDNEFVRRFNVEAQSVASLTHPNIVSVYDVGHDGDLYYIVMELVKGKTLKDIIVEDKVLGWKWSVKIAIQIASALEVAHKNNIVHRDIKPHNIIITEDGVAKVTDFGIAKAVSNSTITAFGATIGSVHYFSPEHAKGGITDAKSDLYSLGVVLYEMVTGKVPFDADTPVSVALMHMQQEPLPPSDINPNVPQSVSQIIMKAMQKDPALRYNSATEMKASLEAVLKNPDAGVASVGTDRFATQRVELNSLKNKKEEMKEEKSDKKESKLKKFFNEHKAAKVIAIILLLILAFVASMVITFAVLNSKKAKNVQIPNFTNMTLEEAKLEAEKYKLTVEVEEEKFDVEIEEGKIISQKPPYQQNYTVKEGSTVKLVISKGQEIVTMTKVVGKTKDEAMKELKDLGLEVEIEEDYHDEIEKGYVVEQDIQENEEILAGSTVKIKVSLGIEQVEVPDLSGKTEEEAKSIIASSKLKWKSTSKINDSSKPNGVVVAQTISPKSMVDKNTEISITINEFTEIKSATIHVNVKSIRKYVPQYETDEEGNQKPINPPEKVTLMIKVGKDPVYEKSVSEDNTDITKEITGFGTVEVKVYINGIMERQNLQMNLYTTNSWTAE